VLSSTAVHQAVSRYRDDGRSGKQKRCLVRVV
jgi:hypothetical protein